NYNSQKYISYKKYNSYYFSKKKRVKHRYLHKYFKKKLQNKRFNIKKKIILKYKRYTKIKNFDPFLANKKRKKLLAGKKLLKYKLSFFKYYFSKYITNSFIVFRNIKKVNSNVKRLFKKYYNFFWYLSRFNFFDDLVYSVLLSKLFVVSDMLGYMIAKLFITPRNHWYMMSNIKN